MVPTLFNLFLVISKKKYIYIHFLRQNARNCYPRTCLMNDIYFEDLLLFSRLDIKYELIQDVLNL